MTDSVTIRTDVSDGIATILLNRPEKRNALTAQMIRALRSAMRATELDSEVRVVVLSGAGDAFCAGLDLFEARQTGANYRETTQPPGLPWSPISKPVIGAINGPAFTGGLEIALHCDILLASTSAAFADTHARVGGMPGWGLSVHLPAAVGDFTARAMSLTGRPISAETAQRVGLVHEVVAPDELMPRAQLLAAEIMHSDPAVLASLLQVYRDTAGLDRCSALRKESELSRSWYAAHPPRTTVGHVR